MSDEQQASVPLTSPHLTRAAVAAAANVYHQVAERYGREVERVMHSLHRLSAAALGTVRRTAARPPSSFFSLIALAGVLLSVSGSLRATGCYTCTHIRRYSTSRCFHGLLGHACHGLMCFNPASAALLMLVLLHIGVLRHTHTHRAGA